MIIGYIVGVFDKLHYGHKNMIMEGFSRCEKLVIGIHTDEFAQSYKRLPTQNQNERSDQMVLFIKSIPNLDLDRFNIEMIDDDHISIIKRYNINKILHGDDWNIDSYKKQIKYYDQGLDKLGVEIELIPYSRGISTTLILNSNIKKSLVKKKCFVFDLDNTLIIDNKPKKFAYDLVSKIYNQEKDIFVVTNNNRYSPESIKSVLDKNQIKIPLKNIITTLTVISKFLKDRGYLNIFIWGTNEAVKYFQDQGFKTSNPKMVVILYKNVFNYGDLVDLVNLSSQVPYIIGNIDRTYPSIEKILPDTGCLWKYLEYCLKKPPLEVFGKPNCIMFDNIVDSFNKDEIVFIGDSIQTDRELANKLNIDFVLVNDTLESDISHLGVLCDYF